MKNLEKARDIGNGLLADVVAAADPAAAPEDVRELAYDLCLARRARARRTSTRSSSGC